MLALFALSPSERLSTPSPVSWHGTLPISRRPHLLLFSSRLEYPGIYDEEAGYTPIHPDDPEFDEEEEEDEEVDILQQFTEVSEIRFPGEIGPMGDRRLCKIRCVKGKWVGPLCATNEEGKWTTPACNNSRPRQCTIKYWSIDIHTNT